MVQAEKILYNKMNEAHDKSRLCQMKASTVSENN